MSLDERIKILGKVFKSPMNERMAHHLLNNNICHRHVQQARAAAKTGRWKGLNSPAQYVLSKIKAQLGSKDQGLEDWFLYMEKETKRLAAKPEYQTVKDKPAGGDNAPKRFSKCDIDEQLKYINFAIEWFSNRPERRPEKQKDYEAQLRVIAASFWSQDCRGVFNIADL